LFFQSFLLQSRRNPTSWGKQGCWGKAGDRFLNGPYLGEIQGILCSYRKAIIYMIKLGYLFLMPEEIIFLKQLHGEGNFLESKAASPNDPI
jgi:hypothetical protein